MTLHTILCPTDFSTPAAYALEAAAILARDHAACLVVLHVAQPRIVIGEVPPLSLPDLDACKRRVWAEFRNLETTNPKLETRVVEGEPAACILDAAREMKADMIVMGTHGRSGVTRLLMGSVAEKVLRGAPCPVMTVKAGMAPLSMAASPPVEACV